MTDFGVLKYFLVLGFVETCIRMVIHRNKYITNVLKRFNMLNCNCNSVDTPMEARFNIDEDDAGTCVDNTVYKQLVDCLRCVCNSRLDITFSVRLVSRFKQEPKQSYTLAVKKILRYLQGTMDVGILLPKCQQ